MMEDKQNEKDDQLAISHSGSSDGCYPLGLIDNHSLQLAANRPAFRTIR